VGDRKLLQFSRDQGVGIERGCEITYQQLERRVAGADAPREGRAKIGNEWRDRRPWHAEGGKTAFRCERQRAYVRIRHQDAIAGAEHGISAELRSGVCARGRRHE